MVGRCEAPTILTMFFYLDLLLFHTHAMVTTAAVMMMCRVTKPVPFHV